MKLKSNFQLNGGDVEILRVVHELRMAHIGHLRVLTGRSAKALSRRLLKLHQERYLSCITRRPQKHVYAIGPEAIPVLIEHGLAPQELERKRLRHQELKELFIKHSLHVVDIHAKLLVQTREGPLKLSHWQEGPALWDHVKVSTDDHRGEMALPVRPDAWFTLQHVERPEGKNKLHFFLEADRSTMSHARMEQKIRAYINYFQKELHKKKYVGMRFFHVLTVTESRARARSLATELGDTIPPATRAWYPFIALEDLTVAMLLPCDASAKKDQPASRLPQKPTPSILIVPPVPAASGDGELLSRAGD
jgi:hypothetical protein